MAQEYMPIDGQLYRQMYPKPTSVYGESKQDTPQGNICSQCFGMRRIATGYFSEEDSDEDTRPCLHCKGTGVEPKVIPILVDCDECGGTGKFTSEFMYTPIACRRCSGTGKLQVGVETAHI